jgi:hypothetical protein
MALQSGIVVVDTRPSLAVTMRHAMRSWERAVLGKTIHGKVEDHNNIYKETSHM